VFDGAGKAHGALRLKGVNTCLIRGMDAVAPRPLFFAMLEKKKYKKNIYSRYIYI